MKLALRLRSFLLWLYILPLTLVVSIIALVRLALLHHSPTQANQLVRTWGRLICRASGVEVTVVGLDHLPGSGPYIFAANHQSQFDIMVLQGYLDVDCRWLAKKELFLVPIWGAAMRRAGYIPVDRSHGRQAMKSLEEAARRIADGTSVIIFPEGTRCVDGLLQPFKAGAMLLAIKAGVPIVPMAIKGTHQVMPKGSLLISPGQVSIRVGTPIDPTRFTAREKHQLAQELRDSVADLLTRT